jgi:mRNA-degrading endonuclease toxin of MazEF toxin-antitoxin module
MPLRGEIWFLASPLDPPGKGRRPVIIVSADVRNQHRGSDAVLVIPLTTSIHKAISTHLYLPAGETGLQSDSVARAEDIMAVRKEILSEPHQRLRQVSSRRICELAGMVREAMGCPAPLLHW